MKLIFAGTPAFAVPSLQALIDSQHEVLAVYTQPDRPAGRGRQLRASPVKNLAESFCLPIMQPQTLRDEEAINTLRDFQPDLMIVVAYGLILPTEVLRLPVHGCINVHASLLPRWRGAAPIQRAILAGDRETGVTIMQMDEGLDTGDMLGIAKLPITEDTSAESLHDELAELGATALQDVVNRIGAGEYPEAVKQDDDQASYATKLSKSEAEIDWTLSARQILRSIKAFNPWPVAFTHWSAKTLRIWDAGIVEKSSQANPGELIALKDGLPVVACGDGALVLLEVQPEGKKRMAADAFMNARKADMQSGTRFGR